MYLTLAWRNIWRNRRRTGITLASVGFAVFFSCLMQSMHLGSWEKMIDNAVRFYTGYVQVHRQGYWHERSLENSFVWRPALQQLAARQPGVRAVVPRLESFALAAGARRTRGALVLGIDPEPENTLTQLKKKLRQGRYLQHRDKAVLVAEGLARYLRLGVGDTLVLIGPGYRGVNAAGKYPVAGLVAFASPQLNDQLVCLPLPEAQELYGAANRLTALALLVDDPGQVPAITGALRRQLRGQGYEVMTWREMMPELVQSFELDSIGGLVIRFILYSVIGFGIFGTFLMMTAERRYEMGVMLAIGMHRIKLQGVMVLEIALLALGGTLAGILLSGALIQYLYLHPIPVTGDLAELYMKFGLEPIVPFSRKAVLFIQQAWVVGLITAVLGLFPLWFIQRLRPVAAMRP
jgi:ABC-type lipoprotein release transport system permease subunit